LRERPAMLRYKYTAYFVVSSFGQVLKRFLTTVFTDTILIHVEKNIYEINGESAGRNEICSYILHSFIPDFFLRTISLQEFRLSQWCRRDLRSSGMLHRVSK
jgi:hypothetical protein